MKEYKQIIDLSLRQKINRVLKDPISIEPYNSKWPEMFKKEKEHLLACLPKNLIKRTEHYGSTAVVNLAAKPIIDILVEVTSLDETKKKIAPILEAQGYDYFWRPTKGDYVKPFYAWFIKRDSQGKRTHHIHMVEKDFEIWDNLLFRDYLREKPLVAQDYESLKISLAQQYKSDRIKYAEGKTDLIVKIIKEAQKYYSN